MAKHIFERTKRLAAFVTCLMLLAAQLALPMAALAQDASVLPAVTLGWTAADGSAQSMAVSASAYGDRFVYWATVPAEAMQTLYVADIVGSDPAMTYTPAAGTSLAAMDATAVDDASATVNVEVYLDGNQLGSCPLYVSTTTGLPPYEAEPAPVIPDPVGVPVRYYCEQEGMDVYSTSVTVDMNGQNVAPDAYVLPEGYTLVSAEPVWVQQNADGSVNQSEVVFYVEKAAPQLPDPVNVAVRYYCEQEGMDVYSTSVTVDMNGQNVAPDAYVLPEGYTLVSGEPVWVQQNADGNVNQSEVVFYVEKAAPQLPDPVSVAVRYYCEQEGMDVYSTSVTVDTNGQNVAPDAYVLPEGYTLVNAEPVWVQQNADGSVNRAEVVFYVEKAKEQEPQLPDPASVPVRYYCEQEGRDVYTASITVDTNGQNVAPDTAVLPEGYALVSAEPVWVQQNADGSVTPGEVVFQVNKTQDESQEPEAPGDEMTVLEECNQYGVTTKGKLNLRSEPVVKKGNEVFKGVNKDEILWAYSRVQMAGDSNTWYKISYQGTDCYVRDDCFRLLTQEEQQEKLGKEIPVKYVDRDTQEVLLTATAQGMPGSAVTVNADLSQLAEYQLEGDASVEVQIDAQGNLSPAEVVFTVVKKQAEPVKGTVTVKYVDTDGKELAPSQSVQREPGVYPVTDFAINTPDGYEPSQVNAQQVEISQDGVATPGEVTFVYKAKEAPKSPATVTFRYVDENGAPLASDRVEQLNAADEPYTSSAYAMEAPEGYAYVGADPEFIYVDGGEGLSIEVVFTYAKKQPDLSPATVTFRYVDENGAPLASDRVEQLNAADGAYTSSAYAMEAPEGYAYVGANPESFYVDGSEGLSIEVVFTYRRKADSVTVHVSYRDADNNEIAGYDETVGVEGKTIVPDASRLPAAYELAAAEGVAVSMNTDGTASVNPVVFSVVKRSAKAPVTFEYVSESGRVVADPLTAELEEGVNDLTTLMEYKAAAEGYTFKSISAQSVTVTPDGKADPARVTFTYTENPTAATVEIHYRNSIGADLCEPEIRQLKPGEHSIAPDASRVPAGYVLSGSVQAQTVKVTNDLVATPNSISFTCYQADIKGAVTITYIDATTNQQITTETRQLSPGSYTLEPDDAVVARVGKYEYTEIVNNNTKVEIKEDGTAVPSSVNFFYKPAENANYLGYVVVTRQTAMRERANANGSVVTTLPVNTLLYVAGQEQSGTTVWHSANTVLGATSSSGWVNDADVRRISTQEAQALIEDYNQQNQPDTPTQSSGYYITLYASVPLRTYTNIYAEARYLKKDTVVYVHGQEYDGSRNIWHLTTYDGVTGYVLNGQLRKLTDAETKQYLAQGGNTSTPTNPGGAQYNPNGASSYGYVTSSGVNFRATPGGTRLKQLNKYAMALIIGTKEVNGVTWYNVNYNGQIGWLHGDYFHQMNLSEFSSFVNSSEYQQGILNNNVTVATAKPSTGSSGSQTSGGNTGSATQGNVSSVEDWNVGTWQNTGVSTQTSYAPFNPYATPVPTPAVRGEYTTASADVKMYDSTGENAASTTLPQNAKLSVNDKVAINGTDWYIVTYNGRTGYVKADAALTEVEATATPEATSTFVIGTMIPINYEDETKETQTGSVPWGLLGGAVVVLGGAGGAYAYALNQNKKRKAAAARAAASKRAAGAAAGTAAAGTTSPYARRAVAAPPVTGTQRPAGGTAPGTNGAAQTPGYNAVKNPYSNGSITGTAQQNPYSRPYSAAQGSAETASPYTGAGSAYGAGGSPSGTQPFAGAADTGTFAGQKAQQPAGMGNGLTGAKPFTDTAYGAGATAGGAAAAASGRQSGSPAGTAPSASSTPTATNPYARPISTPPAQAQSQSGDAGVRRRATRMQRYHTAEGEDEQNH